MLRELPFSCRVRVNLDGLCVIVLAIVPEQERWDLSRLCDQAYCV